MRTNWTQPAQQLRSVCRRYRCAAGRPVPPGRPNRWWLSLGRTGRSTQGDDGSADSRRQRLEAVLLLAREPLNSRKLARYAGLADGTEARTLVRQLNRLYDRTGRAFRVEEVAGGFQLLTRRRFARWLRRLDHVPAETRLSAPAMETLAVVAYRQPVLRAEIEAIRGVSCGEILRQLMDRDLVRIGGRSEELGRPYLYTTTKRFLQLFGLRSLEQLPRAEMLRGADSATLAADPSQPASGTADRQPQEEKSEVTVTTPTQLSAEESLERTVLPGTAAAVRGYDEPDELEEEEFDDDYDDEEWEEDDDEEWEETVDDDEVEAWEEDEDDYEDYEDEFDEEDEEEEWEEDEDDWVDEEDDFDDDEEEEDL